ncbi:MAG: DNA polymerase IV [Alphaproteobacteria bacterium]|nr:DNA polymerase IV [Alphaproteobacteria bacterium]
MMLCRACAHLFENGEHCPACGDDFLLTHAELGALSIAHIDCDAFYASIEKRDDPSLAAKPVIVGGGKRGVVSTACYIARAFGVRSAMPMFKALKLCPNAVVVKPNMAKYVEEGKVIRAMMQALTPQVEPISIDEAFLDLSGTQALHRAAPAQSLARLQAQIAEDRGLTVSVGLSFNKFLAKMASDMDKPRGFCVIGRADALDVLAPRSVSALPGVGPAAATALAKRGWRTIGDLRAAGERRLVEALGDWGRRLHQLSLAQDSRAVDPHGERKSVSAETTFFEDIRARDALEDILWDLSERVAARCRANALAGRTLTLKLRRADFQIVTRRTQLHEPTILAARIFAAARELLAPLAEGRTAYRLIGVGLSDFSDAAAADKGDLIDTRTPKQAAAEAAVAQTREKFGRGAVVTGRALRSHDKDD